MSPSSSRLAAAITLLAAAACGGGRGDDGGGVAAVDSLVLRYGNDSPTGGSRALPVGSPTTLQVSGQTVTSTLECDGYPDSGWCGPTTCAEPLTRHDEVTALDVVVVRASCDADCTATVSGEGVAVSATHPGVAMLTVVGRRAEGGPELSLRTPVTFDTPSAIAVQRELRSSPAWEGDVMLPDTRFVWCPEVVGALEVPLVDHEVTTSVSGVVEEEFAAGACDHFHVLGAGHGTVTFTAGPLSRTIAVDSVDPQAVTAVDLVDLRAWADAPSPPIGTAGNAIASAPALTATSLDGAEGCDSFAVGARFHTTDGRVGLAPESAIRVDPDGAVYRDSDSDSGGEPTSGDANAFATFFPDAAADITVRATVGARSAAVAMHLRGCR